MPHVPPRAPEEVPYLTPILERTKEHLGFVPNSLLTMAHKPHIALAFGLLLGTVRGRDLEEAYQEIADGVPPLDPATEVDPKLLQVAAFSASIASGCRYCQSHTVHSLTKMSIAQEKVDDILVYETSPHYTDAERAVVAVAMAAARLPNEAEAAHFDALRRHFTDPQIVQIVAIIAVFGFLNRWNDTLATELEAAPRVHAENALGALDWSVGKHGG